MAHCAIRPLFPLPISSGRARRSDGLPSSKLSLRRKDTAELATRSLRAWPGDRNVRSAGQVEYAHLSVAQVHSSRGTWRAAAERDTAARQRLVPRLRGVDDGGCPVLGIGCAICHWLYPDGRRTAWRNSRLDRDLPPRCRMARLRSDKQQACRPRTYFGSCRARTREGLADFRLLGRPGGRLQPDECFGTGGPDP